MRRFLTLIALASLPFVHGCAVVALGAAGGAGYIIGEDPRPAAAMADDTAIEVKLNPRIVDKFPDAHINATSYNKLVLLTGEAPTAEAKADIERMARDIEGVRGIYNEIRVAPATSMGARANDSLITSHVKARFVDARKFNAVHVKVVTEASTVYLMGMVKRQVANDATEVARMTRGVQRVVRAFEYQD
jgi:osmotically-inducible protein OsmY